MTATLQSLSPIVEALGFAARKHRDQRRKDSDASPYINHPIALVEVLCIEAGITRRHFSHPRACIPSCLF